MSIFEMADTADNDNTKEKDTRDKVQKSAAFFHKAPTNNDAEPDWQGMLLNAKDFTQKAKIRDARELWQQEQKFKAYEAQKAADAARTVELLRTPIRNKQFYDNLRINESRLYWSTEVQRQMKADKATMGLGWHLKNGGK